MPLGKLDGSAPSTGSRARRLLERPALSRPFRVEQRQLPAPCVRADQREVLLPVDDVHAEVGRRNSAIASRSATQNAT